MAVADIYSKKHRWKIVLALIGLVIVLITMVYSMYLAEKLAENEEQKVRLYVQAVTKMAESSEDPNGSVQQFDEGLSLELSIAEELLSSIPVVLESETGELIGNGYGNERDYDQEFLNTRKKAFIESGKLVIEGTGYSRYVYYDRSRLYNLITYFPLVQILLLSAFVGLGYVVFSSSRRSEQNRVWAGMAKETAHQLGTPISAIIAWIDLLREQLQGNPEQLEIVDELVNDVDRLELVADRFSKIGSLPKLESIDIYEQLEKSRVYMERRASKRIKFDFPKNNEPVFVKMNVHLFEWVVENLIRNSLDAMGGNGTISAVVKSESNMIAIDLSDTGKGIPLNKQKTVFQPGFTTKSRGWGLGLSLAKRIIENYHKGKIFVKNSKVNEGTTFTIKLHKA